MVGVLTNLTVTNLTKSPVTVGSAIKNVTAASLTKAAKISGNALDNTMTGGKGNYTLLGGAGDDSIFGFENEDMLQITGNFSATYDSSKKEIYFAIDSTSKRNYSEKFHGNEL